MNTKQKQALIQAWGFMPTLDGMYFRFAPSGYLEQWIVSQPNTIQFIKDGELSHEYNIDWHLFDKEPK